MSFLDRLLGRGPKTTGDDGLYFYIRCDRCGRVLHTRIDPQRELNKREEGGYELRKELMDDRCFRPFFLTAQLDGNQQIIDVSVDGGQLIDRERWEAEKELPRRPAPPPSDLDN